MTRRRERRTTPGASGLRTPGSEAKREDIQNRATWEAGHNAHGLDELLAEFGNLRTRLVERVSAMGEEELRVTSGHPRLGHPMTVVDLCFFIAEHDDHHLAAITEIRAARGASAFGRRGGP